MRIGGEKKIENSSVKKSSRGSSPGGLFRVADGGKPAQIIATSSTQSVNSVGVLLAAQEQDGAQQQRRATVQRGRNMLSLLDQLKLGYLSGQVPKHTITALGKLSRQSSDATLDPALLSVMRSIELRAEVEIAKLAQQKS